MKITATHINYFHICQRKLWLFSNGIQMEHKSDLVYEGKQLHENAYPQRAEKYTELAFDGIQIDFYDSVNKVVHEIKKSNKLEQAHIAQVKYYIYVLERNGIYGVSGILEYPKLRQTEQVLLTNEDRLLIPVWENEIEKIVESENCPILIKKAICKTCSYFDFCFVEE
jgi:CRISPR-associated exonuclease Cas4